MGGDLFDLQAAVQAASLAGDLVLRLARGFPGPGGWKAAEQIITAAESISNNIAEAYGRGFGSDGLRFLKYARGSATELENQLVVSTRARRFARHEGASYLQRVRRIRAMINGLIKRYERKDDTPDSA